MAIGGLLFSLHPSQDLSFLQEIFNRVNKANTIKMNFAFILNVFVSCYKNFTLRENLLPINAG